ncbi:hypothetical protein F5Y16DRAFT_405873 [Xylariaceae sp. FL0255]|nr:hypothetical protein F5Y16DRAFT_405873 [Xylariaceae sp. FL0255]
MGAAPAVVIGLVVFFLVAAATLLAWRGQLLVHRFAILMFSGKQAQLQARAQRRREREEQEEDNSSGHLMLAGEEVCGAV